MVMGDTSSKARGTRSAYIRAMTSLFRVYGWLIWLYALGVRLTSQWKYEGLAHREAARTHGRVIYALWHQDGAFFCAALRREIPRRLSLLVLGGRKVGMFQGFADLDGFRIHATGSREKTVAAMEAVIRDVRAGAWSAITPDGPMGPPRVCKPGIVELVRAVDGVVLPVSLSCSRYIQTRRWDGVRVPLPFGRFTVRFAPPIVSAACPNNNVLRSTIERGIEACSQWRGEPQGGVV